MKLAMLRVWNGRCSWCTASVGDTAGFQLDHVIPETKFDAYRSRGRITGSFDVHDLENLAPIHGGGDRHCNQRKSNAVDDYAGAIAEISLRAQQRAPQIRKLAAEMLSAEGFERSIIDVLAASMPSGSRHREAFEANAPLLVSRINALCPRAVDHSERVWAVWQDARSSPGFYCIDDVDIFLALELDADGRAAKMISDSYAGAGFDLGRHLLAGATEVIGRLEMAAPDAAEAMGPPFFEETKLRLQPGKKKFKFVASSSVYREWDTNQSFEMGKSRSRETVTSGLFQITVSMDPLSPSRARIAVTDDGPLAWAMSDWEAMESYNAEQP